MDPNIVGSLTIRTPKKGSRIYRNSHIVLTKINSKPASYQPQAPVNETRTPFKEPLQFLETAMGLLPPLEPCTYILMRICIWIYVYIYTHVNVCMYVCMCVYVCR